MGNSVDESSIEHMESTRVVERRMRNIFLGSMALSVLLLVNLVFFVRPGASLHVIFRLYPPLLLWSFTTTSYAFHSVWCLAADRRQLVEEWAATDPNTGVKTLDYVMALLQRECETLTQTGRPTAVIYVGMENLDLVNQNFGHLMRDLVLKDVAKTIQSSTPEAGVVAFMGGDEFVVVLPGTEPEEAKPTASVIGKAIAHYKLDLGVKGWVGYLDSRIGVAACPQDAASADKIIRVAQRAAVRFKGE